MFSNQDFDHITALRLWPCIKVLNDIHLNTDSEKNSVLILLDLSAVFGTFNHNIPLGWLENGMGLCGKALHWFKSCLNDRDYFVSIGNYASERMKMKSESEVLQASILGPLLFNIYMLPLVQIQENNKICYHSYADDTHIYITISPEDYNPIQSHTARVLPRTKKIDRI